jgi:alpha-beta hydrolase superfamily lysophospholipase
MSGDSLPYEEAFRKWVDENDMGWQRVHLRSTTGDQSATAYRLSPAGRPRRVVIALHGAGNDALFAWIGLFKTLLLRGANVLTFDLPGHGRLSRGNFEVDAAVSAVSTAAEQCRSAYSNLPLHAIGVSLGGSVLLRSLPGVQHLLASATLIVAPLRINLTPRAILGEIRPHNLHLLLREREHYGLTGLIPSFGPFKRGTYPLRLGGPIPPGAFGYVDSLNAALAEMRIEQTAATVSLPTLLLYGDRDRVVPIEQGEKLARIIPTAELQPIRGGTHLSTPLEPATSERLVAWLECHG